jgi:hypothetical protein
MGAAMSPVTSSVSDALDGLWRINVNGQIYGPYSGHQLKAFAAEGRIAPHSIVRTGETGPWITAIDDPVLGQLFTQKQPPAAAAMPLRQQLGPAPAGETTSANFVVIADIRSRSSAPFEAAMARMGDLYRLNSLVWLLHSDSGAAAIRNTLIQHLGQTDTLFVIDATRAKIAWFNFGPEPEAKIRRVWKRPADKSGA